MTTINQLSSVDTVQVGDLTVIFSTANGDARKVPLSQLATFLQSQITTTGAMTQFAAPNATGFTVTVAPTVNGGSVWVLMTPTAAFAAGTIVLPSVASAVNGQEVLVNSTQAVTALTVNGNGAVVNGAPASLAANGFFRLRFDAVADVWYRVG